MIVTSLAIDFISVHLAIWMAYRILCGDSLTRFVIPISNFSGRSLTKWVGVYDISYVGKINVLVIVTPL